MEKTKRAWDLLTEEAREKSIKEIIGYFETERDEEIGVVAAGEILDFFQREMGKEIYNKGIEDAKTLLKERLESIELDIDVLRRT